jgi:WD40 repeat protein
MSILSNNILTSESQVAIPPPAKAGGLPLFSCDAGMMNGSDGSVVRRVDMNTGKAVWTRERQMNGPNPDAAAVLNSVAISPNGKYVVLASTDNHLIVLDAQTGHELFRPFVFPERGEVNWAIPGGLAFSADGKTLVSRCGRKTLVWDTEILQ